MPRCSCSSAWGGWQTRSAASSESLLHSRYEDSRLCAALIELRDDQRSNTLSARLGFPQARVRRTPIAPQ